MRVRITLTIEVDEAAWIETYGDEPSAIRESVRCYVEGSVSQSAAADEGAITAVRVTS